MTKPVPVLRLRYDDLLAVPEDARPYVEQSAWAADGQTPLAWSLNVVPQRVFEDADAHHRVMIDSLVDSLRRKDS